MKDSPRAARGGGRARTESWLPNFQPVLLPLALCSELSASPGDTQLPHGANNPKGTAAVLTGLACVLCKANTESSQGLSDEKDVALASTDLTEHSVVNLDVSMGACSQDRGAVTMVTEQPWK